VGLADAGYEVFVAAGSLTPGTKWRDSLDLALQSADAVVVVISEQTASSPGAMMELGAARAYVRESGKPIIIPVVLDHVRLPADLSDIQAVVLSGREIEPVVEGVQRALAEQHGRLLAKKEETAETARKIAVTAPAYIEKAILAQKTLESGNTKFAQVWYGAGFGSLLVGIIFVVYSLHAGSGSDINWVQLVRLLISNVVVIGFLGACARYAFALGKSYTTEALKASDRIHAIAFGQFYLEAFGARAGWSELKEVFAHWNIDRSSNFAAIDVAQIDPQVLTTIAQVAGALTPKK
jgi:hypothetical protein